MARGRSRSRTALPPGEREWTGRSRAPVAHSCPSRGSAPRSSSSSRTASPRTPCPWMARTSRSSSRATSRSRTPQSSRSSKPAGRARSTVPARSGPRRRGWSRQVMDGSKGHGSGPPVLQSGEVPCVTCPQNQRSPRPIRQRLQGEGGTLDVPVQSFIPEPCVEGGPRCAPAAILPVPGTSADEHHRTCDGSAPRHASRVGPSGEVRSGGPFDAALGARVVQGGDAIQAATRRSSGSLGTSSGPLAKSSLRARMASMGSSSAGAPPRFRATTTSRGTAS